ncbi:PI-PLC X domain-containing protein 1 isoform X2 [Gasterosteus aculeatus]|uniref:PI-PLC X domain-containing protein 1-like isoform X2 n=1 Tax=Gasterosteus aculeatus aculeatus TaxID=481459 RepID=UPI001A98EB53|nr:PI-PLC X domain-containing protein 1-like isoform X2 [Gasterosteus aculeatus aculeatus]
MGRHSGKWCLKPDETITKQLDAGVRYFDLRIARKAHDPDPTRLYFHHGLYTRTDVETVLKDVNDWAGGHPKEILVLALSHFHGFDKNVAEQLHRHLTSFIVTLFGAKLIHKRDIPTLKSCWDKGRNVIVSYDSRQHFNELWSKIPYYYGNSMNTRDVESKLCQFLEKPSPAQSFFVCGLNLTLPENARILLYILRPCDNLVKVIRRSLPRLLRWVEQQAAKTPVNIVASDLVTRDGFVPTIIKLNTSKRVKP